MNSFLQGIISPAEPALSLKMQAWVAELRAACHSNSRRGGRFNAEFLPVKNRGIRDGVTMPRTTGLLIVFWKCVAPTEEAAWSRWHDEVHLLDLLGTPGGPCVATRWELAARSAPGMPGLGFTHVAVITSNPLRSLLFGR